MFRILKGLPWNFAVTILAPTPVLCMILCWKTHSCPAFLMSVSSIDG
ncbi:hypothetical protein AZE42_13418 [Rhizopogon vesiculosus]|uniref:Uncharacterized protein n=1 Tax=Rhizopogon vesiculosus TaxID=180088 RepID=A0A1J8Q6Q4_9AGAM|nr:hypothetical protein AZE42_13418 [Rhizopogon vesiculosus]